MVITAFRSFLRNKGSVPLLAHVVSNRFSHAATIIIVTCIFFLSVDIQRLYNKLRYNAVLYITRISVGPQFVILRLIFLYNYFNLVITRYG